MKQGFKEEAEPVGESISQGPEQSVCVCGGEDGRMLGQGRKRSENESAGKLG